MAYSRVPQESYPPPGYAPPYPPPPGYPTPSEAGGYPSPTPPYYQGYLQETYPPTPPPPQAQYSEDESGCTSFLKGFLGALCCCCVLEECCL